MAQPVSYTEESDSIKKQFLQSYLLCITGILALYLIYYWSVQLYPFNYLTASYLVLHLLLIIIVYKVKYDYLKSYIMVYVVVLTLLLYPFMVLFWEAGRITPFMWYFLIPFGMTLFYNFKTIISMGIYIVVLICTAFLLVQVIPEEQYISFVDKQLVIINVATVFFALILISLILYYMNKLRFISVSIPVKEVKTTHLESTHLDDSKYSELYDKILDYMENKEPYCDPGFTISQLASELNSNVSYISRTIKIKKNMNFTSFINLYRISKVKKMLENNYHIKYSLKYIYTYSGFKQQTTFNKVFKQIEGVTPSEYIQSMTKEDGTSYRFD
ncbi:AraC family transcriptional regulator [Apibacter sp. HY039]|uniref:helix-turn-helix domain-containing protein n=1 Tax=Apibacter sp. HY039 TaxID=2501476 RepID=UPI000FEBBF84|nr:helix-turn-helix domain-containing protein [Apibacter sp. HY039]